MPTPQILVVDDTEDYPLLSDECADLVDFRASLEGPDSISWSSYAAVFSHTRNDAADWADDRFEAGDIDGLFVFSGGEDTVSEYLGVYTLPRSLYERRFDAFLKRYDESGSVESSAEVFIANSFDDEQHSSPAQPDSTGHPGTPAEEIDVAGLLRPGDDPPPWCSVNVPVRSRKTERGRELAIDQTLRQLEGLEKVHTLVFRDTYFNDGDGLDLFIHLRMEAGKNYSRYPVYLNLSQSLEAWLRRDSDFTLLATEEAQVLPPDQQVAELLPTTLEALDVESHLRVLENTSLSPKGLKGRHDLANEWGPIQLWNGLRHLSQSDMPLPEWAKENFARLNQRRYYKYLFALSALRAEVGGWAGGKSQSDAKAKYKQWRGFLKQRDSPLQVGLLEDEAGKGWTEALNGLFADVEGSGTVEVLGGLSTLQNLSEAKLDEIARDVKDRDWDVVLVDLRLTKSDQEASSRRAEQLSGVQLIKRLKQDRPDLPTIAVTASNKAWTAKTLRKVGADGYWIKESPEFDVRREYTIQNAADLVGTLHETLQRYENAKPIWSLVTEIRTLKDNRDALRPFVPLTTEKDPYGEVRKRLAAIERRLQRAFGYLVMDPSDHEEEAFAFNRLDLAFLTTWSVLNEVATLYFSDPSYREKDLADTHRKHEFQFLDPKNQSVTVYWKIENGEVSEAEPEMPSSLETYLRPTTQDGSPRWPGRGVDKPRVQWLLHRAGAPELAQRMHDDDFNNSEYNKNSSERPPLRNLRNKLEESHGEVSQVWHAELQDLYDLLRIWRAILPV